MRRTAPAAPFLLADESALELGPWWTTDGEVAGSRVASWDVATDLALTAELTMYPDAVSSSTGISEGLAVLARWRSDLTRVRGVGPAIPLEQLSGTEPRTHHIGLTVPGRVCGGTLEIEMVLFLAEKLGDPGPVTARRPGSILWRSREFITLEGHGARFPMTAVDFDSLVGIDPGASWALEWSPHEPHRSVRAGVRLLINTRREALMNAITAPADDEPSQLVRSLLRYDTARSLVQGALENDELISGADEYEPDTVGRMLLDLVESCWPGVEPAVLAGRWRETPHRLEAELQAAVGAVVT